MNKEALLIQFNQASSEELQALSGVGAVLAERIIAARPFETLESAEAVKGLSSGLIKRLTEATETPVDLGLASVPEADAPADAEESPLESEVESPPVEGEEEAKEADQAPVEERSAPLQGEKSLWESVSGYVMASLAAIILTLAILGGINGGLHFGTNQEVAVLAQEMSQLSDDTASLQKDIDGLRSRVDTLDSLTDRTMSIEQSQAELTEALDALTDDLAATQGELETLNETISQQDERTLRFENFLENLQKNLNAIFGEGEPK